MPSPNPQPRPQPTQQPSVSNINTKQPRVSAATIKPRTQTLPTQTETKPEKRPGSFRLLVGLLATLAGAWLLMLEDYQPGNFVRKVGPGVVSLVESGKVESFNKPTVAATQTVADFLANWQAALPWVVLATGVVLLLFAGVCLKRRMFLFLVTMIILVTASIGLLEAIAITPHLAWIVIGAAVLAYLIHCGHQRVTCPPIGMLGYLLIFVSLMAITRQWFAWPTIVDWVAAQWGGFPKADVGGFLNQWGELVTWCIVLALATLGASLSKGRLLHVLGATLLVIMVVSLFKSAYHELVHFPTLGANVKPLDKFSLTNITSWQWMVLIELVIVSAILVYRGLGAGGLTIAVAAVWLLAGYQIDKTAGRMVMSRELSNQMVQELNQPQYAADGATSTIANRQPSAEEQFEKVVSAATPVVWTYLNTILAALIGLCGIRMMIGDATARWWINNFLWVAFALSVMWIYSNWPEDRYALASLSVGQSGGGFQLNRLLGILGIHPIHKMIAATVALFVAAFAGTWALRWNSRYDSWLYVAATMVFLGTLSSFGALAIMINYGFLEPLPIATYIALAIGQSSLMWVLLLHVNFRDRRVDQVSNSTHQPPRGAVPSFA